MAKPRDFSSTYPVVESEEYEEETSEEESESEPEPPQVNKKTPAPVSKKPDPQPSKIQSAGSSSDDDDESDSETNSDSPIKEPDSTVKPIADTPRNPNPKKSEKSDPEPPQVNKKTPAPVSKKPKPQPSKIQSAGSSSDDDDESDSETNSDSPIKEPDSTVKPMADTPRNPNPKNSRYKSNASGTRTATIAGAKRPSSTSTGRESKRLKQKSETEVEVKLFQRLWSVDDEIAVLQGMIDYRAKKKVDPTVNLNDFHEFIKKLIHIDVSKTQLQDKIRRLKKKYKNNSSKEAEGKYKVSLKAHEQTAYELSKMVWGEEGNALSPKPNGTAVKGSKSKTSVAVETKAETKVNEMVLGGVNGEEDGKGEEGIKYIHVGLDDQKFNGWIVEESWKIMSGEKKEEMEDKWKKLRQKEVEVLVERLELKVEHAKIVLNALK